MAKYTTEAIRNIALVGHSGAGKTTLLESLLAQTKMIGAAGSVEKGNTVADYDPLERQHEHSLDTAITHCDYDGVHLNILDTPGSPDFRGPTLAALTAVETAAIVINAQNGIEFNTHRMMQRAHQRDLCRFIIINKIDADDIDLTQLVRDIRTTFGDICLPINLPTDNSKDVVDVFFNLEGESDIFSVDAAHTEITDQVVEIDEELMEKYLEQGSALAPEELHDAFEKSLRRGHLVPICFVSAKTGAGIPEFLSFARKLLPNPNEGNPPVFLKGEGEDVEEVVISPDRKGHALAHTFKITNDPFVGKLSAFRIFQGTVDKDTQLLIGDARKPFKVGHLFKLQGKEHKEMQRGIPGDICAVAKVDEIEYDSVLHDSHDEDHFHLSPQKFPQPMFGLAVEPKSRGNEQKLSTAMHKLSEEDPCVQIEHAVEQNETILRGLGDLHLRMLLERMKERFNVEVNTRPPRIPYRETIKAAAEGHYRHKKQSGGAGQFGEVFLRIRPLARGEGFRFKSSVVGGAIPTNLIPACEKGIRQVMLEGAIAGYPLQDIEVDVYDGKHHSVDSKEVAFVAAAKKAFLVAIGKAKPQILEPVVDLHVTVPDSKMGDVTGGLASKRAKISGSDANAGGLLTVNAECPLSELSDYQTELKSVTGGQGRYTMDFSHYDPVPHNVQADLVSAFKPKADD